MEPLAALGLVIVLGATAQWLAWRVRLPSILLLLVTGFMVGPVLGWVHPDRLFGDLLLPMVSLSVALILFEGGMSLKFAELRGSGGVVRRLVTTGALITFLLTAGAANLCLGLDWPLAVLAGAVLVVTGPTVVLPLLRHVRPSGSVGQVLKWEGIVIDPIGALLAVLVFEIVGTGRAEHALSFIVLALVKTAVFGTGLGVLAGLLLAQAIRRYWIPDYLYTSVTLMLVVCVFLGCNAVQHEAGLLGVTVMGIALANQRWADVRPIAEFKENLQVFLLAALFVLLSARLERSDLLNVGLGGALFVAVLIVLIRPLAVLVSSVGSTLKWNERGFLMCLAPRGIVAAAVASVFALKLEESGFEGARMLVPVVFMTIVGTVLVYGLLAGPIAQALRVSDPNPQGALIAGAGAFARLLAAALQSRGLRTVMVDTNFSNIAAARMAGLTAIHGSVLSEETFKQMDLAGIGRLLAMTPSDEVNVLAVHRFSRYFGRAQAYQLHPESDPDSRGGLERKLHGRWLFSPESTYARLTTLCASRATIKSTRISEEFNWAAFRRQYGSAALPLLVVSENGRVAVVAADDKVEPRPGQTVVCLLASPETSDSERNTSRAAAPA